MPERTNYRVNWIAAGIIAIAAILPRPATASGEDGVLNEIKEIVIKANEAGYTFTLSTDDADTLMTIKVEWGGKVHEFGKKDFGHLDRPDFREYDVKTPTVSSMRKPDHLIVILPYNRESVGKSDESYNQWDVVRLHFNKGQLSMWEKAEAVEGKPGKWKLTSKGEILSAVVDGVNKVDKHGVYDSGIITSKKNPYNQWPIRER